MAKRDFYDVLGVAKGASEEEIKKAFRRKAMELHPDRNQDNPKSEHQFKEVNEAYDCLKDRQRKAAYDRFGHAAFDGAAASGFHRAAQGHDFGGTFSDVFDDLFGDFMGGRSRSQRATRGSDLRYNLRMTLEEAFSGKQVGQVRSTVKKPCCARTLPIPEQVGQVDGSAPPSAPVPLQTSQTALVGTVMPACLPLKASSSVIRRL